MLFASQRHVSFRPRMRDDDFCLDTGCGPGPGAPNGAYGRRPRPTRGRSATGRMHSPYSCIHALKGEKGEKRRGSEYAEYTEYIFGIPYGSRAEGPNLYAFGI